MKVPSVDGRTVLHATTRLEQLGFGARIVNEYSDLVPRGRVIGQLPKGGSEAPEGADVILMVSSGPAAHVHQVVILPEVVGMHEQEASDLLEGAGLNVHVAYEHNPAYPEGVVTAQLPDRMPLPTARRSRAPWWVWAITAAALMLAAVLAVVILGMQRRVAVPDVLGMTQSQASETLREKGLKPRVVPAASTDEAGVPAGSVSGQDPLAGSIVAEGSIVEVRVVGGSQGALVPDVVGLTREEAQSRLRAAGFIVQLEERQTNEARVGLVVSQEPASGTRLEVGASVVIVIARATGPDLATVPRVEGMARDSAEQSVRDVGLDVAVVQNPSADVAEGVVVMQYPAAGGQVTRGTTVGLIVSGGPPEDATTLQSPDVRSLQLTDAESRVANAGFDSFPVLVNGSGVTRYEVIAQLPPAGSVMTPGSKVLLFYSTGQ
jgi:beta-lactam-binding protein with PASTA domain